MNNAESSAHRLQGFPGTLTLEIGKSRPFNAEICPLSILAEEILRQALQLPPNERAALIEGLIISLDKPDPSLDALWLQEAESRLSAYRSGELDAVDAEQVFAELGQQV